MNDIERPWCERTLFKSLNVQNIHLSLIYVVDKFAIEHIFVFTTGSRLFLVLFYCRYQTKRNKVNDI